MLTANVSRASELEAREVEHGHKWSRSSSKDLQPPSAGLFEELNSLAISC